MRSDALSRLSGKDDSRRRRIREFWSTLWGHPIEFALHYGNLDGLTPSRSPTDLRFPCPAYEGSIRLFNGVAGSANVLGSRRAIPRSTATSCRPSSTTLHHLFDAAGVPYEAFCSRSVSANEKLRHCDRSRRCEPQLPLRPSWRRHDEGSNEAVQPPSPREVSRGRRWIPARPSV